MATGTNGIATEGEAKSKLGYSGSVDTNKCCTKARAIAMGADSSKLTEYQDNQLVKYSDIYSTGEPYYLGFNIQATQQNKWWAHITSIYLRAYKTVQITGGFFVTKVIKTAPQNTKVLVRLTLYSSNGSSNLSTYQIVNQQVDFSANSDALPIPLTPIQAPESANIFMASADSNVLNFLKTWDSNCKGFCSPTYQVGV